MKEPLIVRYRPVEFDEIVGHEAVIKALKNVLAHDGCPHAYLITGPSGTGKTTLARIIGAYLGAEITEIDGASNNGVDDVRAIQELAHHVSFGGSGKRLIIVDECHMLSRSAWNALLKLLEDPPPHLFLALCTTEAHKMQETVVNRCYPIALRSLSIAEITDLLALVIEMETWNVHPDVFDLVLGACDGSPRKALTLLQAVHDAPSRSEAGRIINLVDMSDPLKEVLLHLASGKRSWKLLRPLIQKLDPASLDEAITPASRYMCSAMLNTEEDAAAAALWGVLEALVFPAAGFDRRASFIAAIGRILWGS